MSLSSHAFALDHRQRRLGVVLEARRSILVGLRQGDPSLKPVPGVRSCARLGGRPFGMGDAAARHHPVDVALTDDLAGSHAVPMKDLAAKEISDGREPDMGVGTDIGSLPRWDLRRPELVEEDEWTDNLPLGRGQSAADHEAAKVDRARHDQGFDGVRADGVGIAGLEQRVPTHRRLTSRRGARRRRRCPCRRGRRGSSPSGGPSGAWGRARSPWPAHAPAPAPG